MIKRIARHTGFKTFVEAYKQSKEQDFNVVGFGYNEEDKHYFDTE